MLFAKKLRQRIKDGEITTSIRIWQKPRVKLGGHYALDDGEVVINSIQEINLADISELMAKQSGFINK